MASAADYARRWNRALPPADVLAGRLVEAGKPFPICGAGAAFVLPAEITECSTERRRVIVAGAAGGEPRRPDRSAESMRHPPSARHRPASRRTRSGAPYMSEKKPLRLPAAPSLL